MSPRRTTVPSTRVSSRSSQTGRSGLIAKEKDEKQSAQKRSALDNRFHRTIFRYTARRGLTWRRQSGATIAAPRMLIRGRDLQRRDAAAVPLNEARKRRTEAGPRRFQRKVRPLAALQA